MSREEARILIGVPCMDMMHSRFVESLFRMHTPENTTIMFAMNSLIYDARDSLAREAIEGGYDYLCFIDSDMVFEQDALMKLLARNVDIVTGLYFQRKNSHTPCIFSEVEPYSIQYEKEFKKADFFETEAFGTGFCLISVDSLKDTFEQTGYLFQPAHGMGEDLSFCKRAKAVGYKLWVDTTVRLGHIGTYIYDENDYGVEFEEFRP